MEGLQQSNTQDSLDKKITRKWRKNTEVKILRSVGAEAEGHVDLWRQVIGETPKANKDAVVSEKISQESKRVPATEAHNIHGGLQFERIGQVLLSAAESETRKQTESSSVESDESQKVQPETIVQYIASVGREELLDISSRIAVEGTTLRQAFETHLIGENALRRIIIEHIRGGDVKAALRREMMQHEIDFERDPYLRDHANQTIEDKNKESEKTAAETILPELTIPARPDPGARVVKVKSPKKVSFSKKPTEKKPFNPQVMDIALISIIIVLLVVVIVLLILRR